MPGVATETLNKTMINTVIFENWRFFTEALRAQTLSMFYD